MTPEQESLRDSIEDRWGRAWDGHMFLSWMVENREMVVRALYGDEAMTGYVCKSHVHLDDFDMHTDQPPFPVGQRTLVLPREDAS